MSVCLRKAKVGAAMIVALAACAHDPPPPPKVALPPATTGPLTIDVTSLAKVSGDPTNVLAKTMGSGDTEAAFAAMQRLYAAAGATSSETLLLVTQPFDRPLSSYYQHRERITLSRLLRLEQEGPLYWHNWSRVLTQGSWSLGKQLDPTGAQRLGNFAVIGILAHEMGHYLMSRYGVAPANRHVSELYADELAVAIMNQLASHPQLATLRQQYRKLIAGELLDAIPPTDRPTPPAPGADLVAWAKDLKLPRKPRPYVAIQLTRQRHLLSRSPPLQLNAVVKRLLVNPWQELQTKRVFVKGVKVETVAATPFSLARYTNFGLTTDGSLCGLKVDSPVAELYCVEEKRKLALQARYLSKLTSIRGIAFVSRRLFYIARAGQKRGIIEIHRVEVSPRKVDEKQVATLNLPGQGYLWTKLAVSPNGRIYLLHTMPGKATMRMLRVEPDGRTRELYRFKASSDRHRYVDGPLGEVGFTLDAFAVDADENIIGSSGAGILRVLRDGNIRTAVGPLRGYQDGDQRRAAVFDVQCLAAQTDGSLLVIDERRTRPPQGYFLRRIRY